MENKNKNLKHNVVYANISVINQKNTMTPLKITTYNEEPPTTYKYEKIQDPKYKSELVYPPNPEFVEIYQLWEMHQSRFWSSAELRPIYDMDKFAQADITLQRITMEMVACLMHGDSVVLDSLSGDLMSTITVEPVIAFFKDQEAREMIHKVVYSKMLDMAPLEAEYYRSEAFKHSRMGGFVELTQRYREFGDIKVLLFAIMICENIMFAPMFQQICYLATTGFAQNLCKANELVMRDEYLHYKHARILLSKCRSLLDHHTAECLLNDIVNVTEQLIIRIVGDFVSIDGKYSCDIALRHFRYVVHHFRLENMLYKTKDAQEMNEKLYGISPAQSYMSDVELELRSNLMESESTVYAQLGDTKPINMNLQFKKFVGNTRRNT